MSGCTHEWSKGKLNCPYCEIDRLNKEINRLRQYEDAITSAIDGTLLVWNLISTNHTVIKNDYWQNHLEEIDRLKAELEEASTIANDNYQVILKCNAQINDYKRQLDSFKESTESDWLRINALVEEQSSWSLKAVEQFNRADDLERQLAEARAEINRRDEFCGKCENGQLVTLEQARQEAARTVERHLLGMFWCIPSKENEPMIYRDQAIEWLRGAFGLEGEG